MRFDWDEIVRRPLVAPRFAAVYAPPGDNDKTKISAGIGLYYEHTQLEYLAQTFAGIRYDTYYQADGVTPSGPAEESAFNWNQAALRAPRAVNWSVGVERELPWSIVAGANFLDDSPGLFPVWPGGSSAGPLEQNPQPRRRVLPRMHRAVSCGHWCRAN